jgi:type IV pilus assembly protein PilC
MKKQKKTTWLKTEISIGGVKDVDILLFTKHLSVVLKSGLTLIEGLDLVRDQAKGKMKKMLNKIHSKVSSGSTFHEALNEYKKYFSPIYLNMVRSGELSGRLDENLERLGTQLAKSYELRKKIKSAMIYPILVFVAVFGLGMAVSLFVLPQIIPLFTVLDVELPVTTRALLAVAKIMEKWGIYIAAGLTSGFIFLFWFFKRNFIKPITHWIILKLPLVKNLSSKINIERFCYTFGSLLESGLTVDEGLKITAEATENRVYKEHVLALLPQIQAGASISDSVAQYPKLFPVIVSRMIGVGERTGNLDSTLKYLSGFYEKEVDDLTKNLSTIIEPALLIIIGIVVGLVAIAILGPIYEITGSLRN